MKYYKTKEYGRVGDVRQDGRIRVVRIREEDDYWTVLLSIDRAAEGGGIETGELEFELTRGQALRLAEAILKARGKGPR